MVIAAPPVSDSPSAPESVKVSSCTLAVSNEMPFSEMLVESYHMGLADGPTQVHKVTVARQILRGYEPAPGLFPTGHLPAQQRVALARYADVLERHLEQI